MARSRKSRLQRDKLHRLGRSGAAVGDKRASQSARNIRETIESIVIAFVLAFLFRTFEAEAFVIPTGSMAPTLRGMHKDVECPQCGFWYQTSASNEAEDEMQRIRLELQRVEAELSRIQPAPERAALEMRRAQLRAETAYPQHQVARRKVVSVTCPMCRYTMRADDQPSYNGDRILVNKFDYDVRDPDRWDVIVFKFPGDAKMNYIKRLVGLPNETVRIYQGDLFIKSPGADEFQIARKTPRLTRATLQLVHDSRCQPRYLAERNWPLRWQANSSDDGQQAGRWVAGTASEAGSDVSQVFSIDGTSTARHWLRYRHFVPSGEQWDRIRSGPLDSGEVAQIRPQLITDFCAYNTWTTRDQGHTLTPPQRGLHWVGDLMVECDVEVKRPRGQLLLDLVEGGKHFQCGIELTTGTATLTIDSVEDFAPSAVTPAGSPGRYKLGFANVNDQLLLWVNDAPIHFDAPTTYDAAVVFGDRQQIRPQSTPEDAGDLAPVGVGAQGAEVEITGLRVLRDTYYIADQYGAGGQPITDYDPSGPPVDHLSNQRLAEFLSTPVAWDVFTRRQHVDFPLEDDQFFVLGDNSPFSKDGRLWPVEGFGHYVERQLLIGKAMFVYWPHSWNRIPGTPIPLPFFPNFADMKLVR